MGREQAGMGREGTGWCRESLNRMQERDTGA